MSLSQSTHLLSSLEHFLQFLDWITEQSYSVNDPITLKAKLYFSKYQNIATDCNGPSIIGEGGVWGKIIFISTSVDIEFLELLQTLRTLDIVHLGMVPGGGSIHIQTWKVDILTF